MEFLQVCPEAGGYVSTCTVVNRNISDTIGATISTYDDCSIEATTTDDQAIVVLDGVFRVRTGDDFSRVMEARFGDVLWLPKRTRLKYEGEHAKVFSGFYPLNGAAPGADDGEDSEPAQPLQFKSSDMHFSQMHIHAGGYSSVCRLIGPETSSTIGAGIGTYDQCSITWQTHYDQVLIVLGGTLRLLTGMDYSRAVEGTRGDVIWLPKGTHLKYQGDRASQFYVPYPVDWRSHTSLY
ncbi:hypothetical protein ACFWAY_41350 [Rhodococcus sp. NPDC059968]|uniref:hypothetical protein n=1 Tax=Rhodococcus sp. NPDC059968 TaxID=3347017 RepID=UPI00366AA7C3